MAGPKAALLCLLVPMPTGFAEQRFKIVDGLEAEFRLRLGRDVDPLDAPRQGPASGCERRLSPRYVASDDCRRVSQQLLQVGFVERRPRRDVERTQRPQTLDRESVRCCGIPDVDRPREPMDGSLLSR